MSDPRPAASSVAVIVLDNVGGMHTADHDRITRRMQAARIATLLALPFNPARPAAGPVYVITADTLDPDTAARLGVHDESRIYGGVAPWPFVATKAVTHGLRSSNAVAPQGWNPRLVAALADCVLLGWTTFSLDDARRAGIDLLETGTVRLKNVKSTAGRGQTRVRTLAELEIALADRNPDDIARHGIVVEEDLVDPETLSVGTTRIGDERIAYWGVQRLTESPDGETVYGGSDLQVALGDYENLLSFPLPERARLAIQFARAYDAGVFAAYPGLFASRRNYDVIFGLNAQGIRRTGVLEQSWRIGGASGAEIAAIEAFRRDRTRRLVRSETMEIRSASASVPDDAVLYYQGVDPEAGPLTKYARVVP